MPTVSVVQEGWTPFLLQASTRKATGVMRVLLHPISVEGVARALSASPVAVTMQVVVGHLGTLLKKHKQYCWLL